MILELKIPYDIAVSDKPGTDSAGSDSGSGVASNRPIRSRKPFASEAPGSCRNEGRGNADGDSAVGGRDRVGTLKLTSFTLTACCRSVPKTWALLFQELNGESSRIRRQQSGTRFQNGIISPFWNSLQMLILIDSKHSYNWNANCIRSLANYGLTAYLCRQRNGRPHGIWWNILANNMANTVARWVIKRIANSTIYINLNFRLCKASGRTSFPGQSHIIREFLGPGSGGTRIFCVGPHPPALFYTRNGVFRISGKPAADRGRLPFTAIRATRGNRSWSTRRRR